MTHPPPGRNDACPCGSGRKYKRCCMEREQAHRSADGHLRLDDGKSSSSSRIFDPELRSEMSDVWELDAVPFPARFADDAAARPVAVLIGSGPIVVHASTLDSAPAEPDELASILAREVDAAIAAAERVPLRIHVRHESVADALRPVLGRRGIAVRAVGRLTNLRDAAESLVAHLGGIENAPMASLPETWAGWGIPRDDIAGLFRAAAAYYRARPWQLVANDEPIRASLPGGAEWHSIVLGNAGQEYGLALYSDRADLEYLYSGPDPRRALLEVGGTLLSITYATKAALPPRMRREVHDAGWEIAGPAAYPLLMVLGTPGGGVRRSQIGQLIALLGAVPRFVAARHEGVSGGAPAEAWTDSLTSAELLFEGPSASWLETFWDRPGHLTLCGPAGPGATSDVRLRDVPDEERAALVRKTLDRFIQHCQTDGRFAAVSAPTAMKHARPAWLFLQFLTGYQEIGPGGVTEFDLREFLYNWYPRKVMASEQEARGVLGSLRRFFSFLAEVDGIECPWADQVLRDRDAFLAMWYSSRGLGPEARNNNWLAPFTADLEQRAFLPANDAEAIEWGGLMGEKEATLFDEVQRLWLRWRDEIIRAGTKDRDAVYAALKQRQRAWANTPNALVGNETPVRAVKRERQGSRRK